MSRPECVLTHSSGLILIPNWTDNGGISLIAPSGGTHHVQSLYSKPLRPNGIALENGGTVLLAHLGDTQGGIYRLSADGHVEPVVMTVDGEPMPPANFVVQDSQGRIWLTVSTRKTPRSADYRASASTGFIAVAEPGQNDARIVADGLGYTNECVIDEVRGHVWVNETFSRKLTRFTISNTDSIQLSDAHCVYRFGVGSYPDGLALDEEGYLWVTSILSNRILRISPDGVMQRMFEDSDESHLQWTEEAYQKDALGREHLDTARSEVMKNISNLAFGGPTRQRIYVGNLLGDSLPFFDTQFTGVAMPHWDAELGELLPLLQDSAT
ncbi:Virginiamycin B lyase [Granulosicoccus antarcticus IMCC3135]|uniref:Virginiamycin B lyase n=1 Tax=Granulosicoccus antarcticus IMCC3135 TaxID=1192854 RepID=A0A2Z2NXG4_9GAMM|nr:Virginiamycin B lyase [Granulosicoccus antarcticus IMCC3135]